MLGYQEGGSTHHSSAGNHLWKNELLHIRRMLRALIPISAHSQKCMNGLLAVGGHCQNLANKPSK